MYKFRGLSSLIWSEADNVLRGFSKNVYDIIEKFNLDRSAKKLNRILFSHFFNAGIISSMNDETTVERHC
ncbi:MAG: hypothetical protein M0P58_11780 [Bacteroidales bacterium]|jgi:hypothetical protein|nr:hypothetical protein [Bacteroidales bacterium]